MSDTFVIQFNIIYKAGSLLFVSTTKIVIIRTKPRSKVHKITMTRTYLKHHPNPFYTLTSKLTINIFATYSKVEMKRRTCLDPS